MIAFICICYGSLYFLLFNKLGLLKKTPGNISAFAGVGVVLVGAVVFAWYTFSPVSSDARMFRYIIPIVPNVRGEVVEVPIEGAEPLEAGDTLSRIDPEPFEIAVRQRAAQVQRFEAEYRLAEVNVVSSLPAASPMAFISEETNSVLASFSQSAIRKIAVGDSAEVVFAHIPGEVFAGHVIRVVPTSSEAQLTASGQLPSFTGAPATDRWGVMIELFEPEDAGRIPQGAGGTVAVYTQSGKPVHIISKVALRMSAWLGYLTAP